MATGFNLTRNLMSGRKVKVINGKKKCTNCYEIKEANDINFNKKYKKNGEHYFRSKCKECIKNKTPAKYTEFSLIKECAQCNISLPLNKNNFQFRKDIGKFRSVCKLCIRDYNIKYNDDNFEKLNKLRVIFYAKNKEELLIKNKKYRDKFKKIKDPIILERKKYRNRLRNNISRVIVKNLKIREKIKNGSISKYLPYTMEKLMTHIESQFESWMNWNNHGKYNAKTWNDNDSSTWVWNLDHIVPHSKFQYQSMADEEFQKCWALSNLRPLSGKQNIRDNCRR